MKTGAPLNPEERKIASEACLSKRGIAINQFLPLIESEDETRLRSPDELLRRLVALWAVSGTAFLKDDPHFRDYVESTGTQSWLSAKERKFLVNDARSERDYIAFSWRLEALYFLVWCGGLVDQIDLPVDESSIGAIAHLFPDNMEAPDKLASALRMRGKAEILDWADKLYRLHWAVRDARLNGKPGPKGIIGGAVQEWHYAVNWITCYADEDDWDEVDTDT